MRIRGVGAVALLLLGAASVALAQVSRDERAPAVYFDEADATVRSHLQQAEEFLAHKQWDEAIDRFRTLMDLGEGQVVASGPASSSLGDAFQRYVPLREQVQRQLAGLYASAPEALAAYRSQIEPLAKQLLEQAAASRDETLLRQIVERWFLSRSGDDAALRLGDMELERGHIDVARSLWEQLHPSLRAPQNFHEPLMAAGGASWWMALRQVDLDAHWHELAPLLSEDRPLDRTLAYPDTDIPLAQVWARLALASALEGSLERARLESEILHRLYPDADGELAGRSGKLSGIAAALVDQSANWPSPGNASDWPTFAGAAERGRAAPRSVDLAGRPLWRRPLEKPELESEPPLPGFASLASPPGSHLASFPAIADGVVWRCDLERIFALRLQDGRPAFPTGSPEGEGRVFGPDEFSQWAGRNSDSRPQVGAPRFTVTIHQDKVYARVGWPHVHSTERERMFSQERGYLVGLDRKTLKLLHPRIEPGDPLWAFEGTPLVDDRAVYVAMRRSEARTQMYVACYDGRTGELRWRQKICSAPTPGGGRLRIFSHNLLTRHEDTVYYNTNLGAVAALDVRDGAIRWLASYPRVPLETSGYRAEAQMSRGLSPCLVHRGLVYVAPADSDRIFALDAQTGQMRWTTPPDGAADAGRLLGVGEGRLVASGVGLYWLDALTGRFVGHFPENGVLEQGRARPAPGGYGRGLLAGSQVLWPTREKIYIFDQRTRREEGRWTPVLRGEIELTQRGEGITGGNLAIAEGVLVIATDDELIAFDEQGPEQ